MAWNHPVQKIESESKTAKSSRVWWGLGTGLIVAVAAVAGVVSYFAGTGRPRPEKTAADEEVAQEVSKPKQSRTIREVKPAAAPTYNVVAEKLQGCKFLMNGQVKQKAKVYLCLFSASWCPPCRAEMPRIAKTYAETLKGDPDIELVHFSRDREESKAMDWAKKHDVKFPVVRYDGGNPLDLHCKGIPHLFIVKDYATEGIVAAVAATGGDDEVVFAAGDWVVEDDFGGDGVAFEDFRLLDDFYDVVS